MIWVMTIVLAVSGQADVVSHREYATKADCFKAIQTEMPATSKALLGDRVGSVTARCDPRSG